MPDASYGHSCDWPKPIPKINSGVQPQRDNKRGQGGDAKYDLPLGHIYGYMPYPAYQGYMPRHSERFNQ